MRVPRRHAVRNHGADIGIATHVATTSLGPLIVGDPLVETRNAEKVITMKSGFPNRAKKARYALVCDAATCRLAVWTILVFVVSLQLHAFPAKSGEITFASPGMFEHGHNTFGIVAADLDSDGDLDLSVANAQCCMRDLANENSASVALNNGDGTFAPADNYKVGTFPASIAAGDLNGDGSLDLALANQESSDVSVLLNHGDGTFADHISFFAGDIPHSVIAEDLNGDQVLDLTVANYGANQLAVLLGNGNGTFDHRVVYSTGSKPVQVTAGDLNRDGRLDLITANSDSDDVSVLLANDDGTFGQTVNYPAANQPMSVDVADVDNDGDLDLAVANRQSGAITIHLNDGDGSFADGQAFNAGPSANFVMAEDLDVDGNLDLAVANHNGQGRISTLRGKGDGTFEELNYVTFSGVPRNTHLWFWSLTVADLDGDDVFDLAVPNSNTGNSGTNGLILLNTTEVLSGPACDFDANDVCDVVDLDALLDNLGSSDPTYDLVSDGVITLADRDEWLSIAGQRDIGVDYLAGDTELNGQINTADLNELALAWGRTDNPGWPNGDFNGDDMVDAVDLNDIGINWQHGVDAAIAVPEPATSVLLWVTLLSLAGGRHPRGLLVATPSTLKQVGTAATRSHQRNAIGGLARITR